MTVLGRINDSRLFAWISLTALSRTYLIDEINSSNNVLLCILDEILCFDSYRSLFVSYMM